MKSLLSDVTENSGKTPYQLYTIQCQFDKFEVIVPFKNSSLFENQLTLEVRMDHGAFHGSKADVMSIVKAFGGAEFKGNKES